MMIKSGDARGMERGKGKRKGKGKGKEGRIDLVVLVIGLTWYDRLNRLDPV